MIRDLFDTPGLSACPMNQDELSAHVRELLELLGATPGHLAALLGMSRPHISGCINGSRPGLPAVQISLELIRAAVRIRTEHGLPVPPRVTEILAHLAERPRQRAPSRSGRRQRV